MPEPIIASTSALDQLHSRPSVLSGSLALMKPVTWFAPTWAFLCGGVASASIQFTSHDMGRLAIGTFLAGPILCGLSQVVNDYCDREVDAINEPNRPIPSGLVTQYQVFFTTGVLAVIALGIALFLGPQVALLTAIGMVLAVIYSAHPIRAKRNGWIGNALVAVAYEGLPWLAGHVAFGQITTASILMAGFYSIGAHGIMTINDFKSMDGDRQLGIKTIPVLYGPKGAAWLAVIIMDLSQLLVILAFVWWSRPLFAIIISVLFVLQLPLQRRFIQDPRGRAIFYNATGTMLFVWGMLAAAIGIR